MKTKSILPPLIAFLLCAGAAFPRDLYVRAGSDGAGTRAAPFGDPWQALEAAKPKDVIRVAGGVYHGFLRSGSYRIRIDHCTLFGGYAPDFAQRDPFRYLTVLEQAADYQGGDASRPILAAGTLTDPVADVVIDGFAIDGRTKNVYDSTGQIVLDGVGLFSLVDLYGRDLKLKNCIVLNHSFRGITAQWTGRENEISNCFFVNLYYAALDGQGQHDAVVRISHNTFAFAWQRLSSRGAVLIPPRLAAVIENNVFMYLQPTAVDNLCPSTVLSNNVFFQCQNGFYRGRDGYSRNALVWRPEDFKTMAGYPALFQLKSAAGNAVVDTGVRPDPQYFKGFSEMFSQDPDKLDMEKLNELRRQMGYSLAPVPPSKTVTGLAYRLEAVVPALVFAGGQGARPLPPAALTGAP
jgi:hypothetical protein